MTEIEQLRATLERFAGVSVIEVDLGGDTELVHPGKRMDVGFGTWYVRFALERSERGWETLALLAAIVNNDMQLSGARFFILPFAFPAKDADNADGERLNFVIEGGKARDIVWLVERLQQGLEQGW